MASVIAGQLALLVVVAVAIRTVYVAFLQQRLHVTFADAPARSLLYFALSSTILVALFPDEVRQLFSGVSTLGYFALATLFFVLFPALYRMLRRTVGAPTWLYKTFPSQTLLTLEESYIVSKVGDVVSQQLVGGIFILLLSEAGVSYDVVVFAFMGLFLLSHVYLFFTSGFIWGLYYSGLALGGAFAIPFFVVFVPGGIVWSIILHMLFYVLASTFFAKLPRPTKAVCYDILGVPPEQEGGNAR